MGTRIEIIGSPAYSWGRRTQPPEREVPASRRSVLSTAIITVLVAVVGVGAGVFLLASDAHVFDATSALASPASTSPDVAPLPALLALPPIQPAAAGHALEPDAPANDAAQALLTSADPATAPAVGQPARRGPRAAPSASDPFRRARRVGHSRL